MHKTHNSHRVHLKLVRAIVLVFLVFFSLSYSSIAQAQTDYYHKDFKWNYKGDEWTWSLDIPKSLYESYKKVTVSTRTRNGPEAYSFLTTTNDVYMQLVAEKLKQSATNKGYDSYDTVSFVLAFVQSLPYTSDSVTSGYDEYPRFPIETLVDGGGDCEDTAILFAVITLIMNYGTVYISPSGHFAVGILGDGLQGYYYTYKEKTYYYCETTGYGFEIGEIPSEYKNVEAHIYEINEYQQYTPSSPSFNIPSHVVLVGTFGAIAIAFIIIALIRRNRIIQATPQISEEIVIANQKEPVSTPTRFCRYCGSSNELDAVFCEKCGRNIE